jgi:hypothetical protein
LFRIQLSGKFSLNNNICFWRYDKDARKKSKTPVVAKVNSDDLIRPNGAKRRIAENREESYTDKDTQVSQPKLPRSIHPHFFEQISLVIAKLVLIRELLAEIRAKTVILLRMNYASQVSG